MKKATPLVSSAPCCVGKTHAGKVCLSVRQAEEEGCKVEACPEVNVQAEAVERKTEERQRRSLVEEHQLRMPQ